MLEHLKDRLAEVADLHHAANLLEWDQETYMPSGAVQARAQQVSTLRRLAHERFTDDRVGGWLETAAADDADTKALLRVTRRDYARAVKLPAALVADLAEAVAFGKQAWKAAREDDAFDRFAPALTRLVQLNRDKADALGFPAERYDALLDEYEPGMATADVVRIFAELREALVPIVEMIAEQPAPDDGMLRQPFSRDAQWDVGMAVLRDIGYDFERGRQDRSAHPFTTSFSVTDVRLTTRIDEAYFPTAFFGTLHEAGHGLYEQGIDPRYERTPLAEAASLGLHESQSRLWENIVGRSLPFWQHYYPQLKAVFPRQLGDVPLEAFHRAVNRVEPSLIRVEADEVTYNLHIMLRFELERALLRGDLTVAELPGAWRSEMDRLLGITPTTDAEGVLQDVHWSLGALGYFPTYALGNLMSAQIFDAAAADLGWLEGRLEAGTFTPLLTWLREHIHQHGRTRTAAELLEDVTGAPLRATSWLAYIRAKYGRLYDVSE